ncbi:hypothetical protein MLD38_020837 [Melastoma candidum]|nr:hypothetical protein MLD38_020837 [Melastoma candidum]
MERGDEVVATRTRQQTSMQHNRVSGRGKRKSVVHKVVRGVAQKAGDFSGSRATSTVGRQTRMRFVRSDCSIAEDGDDRSIALEKCVKKKIGAIRHSGEKRKSCGNSEPAFPRKTPDVGDCEVEYDSTGEKKVTDEVEEETGVVPGTRAPSCVAHRTRSQFRKLTSGVMKAGGKEPEDYILIVDTDENSNGVEEEIDGEDIMKDVEVLDNSIFVRNRKDKGNEDDLCQNLPLGDEVIEIRRSMPVASRISRQIRIQCDEVSSKRRKLGDGSAKYDSIRDKGVSEVQEMARDSSGILDTSCVAHRTRSQLAESKCSWTRAGHNSSGNVIQIDDEDDEDNAEEEEDKDEDNMGDVIKGDEAKEESIDGGSRQAEDKDDDLNKYMSEEELLMSCSKKENDVLKNEDLVEKFKSQLCKGEAYIFVERGEKCKTVMLDIEDVSSYPRVRQLPMCVARLIKSHDIKQRSDFSMGENNRLEDSIHIVDDGDDDEEEMEKEEDDGEEEDRVKVCNVMEDSIKEDISDNASNEDDLTDIYVEEESSADKYDEVDSMDDSVTEESSEVEYDEDGLKEYKSVDGKEGNDSEENDPHSSDLENEFSMDASADMLSSQMPACIARRTRSHFKALRSDVMNDGTFSNPCCLDNDGDDQNIALQYNNSSGLHKDLFGGKSRSFEVNKTKVTNAIEGRVESSDEEDQNIGLHDNNSCAIHKDLLVGKCGSSEFCERELTSASEGGVDHIQIPKSNGGESRPPDKRLFKHPNDARKIQPADSARENIVECRQKPNGHSKRKHIRQAYDARKVLLEAIWGQRDSLRESIGIVISKVGRITNWKFTFEEDSQPLEKSDSELEFDKLWMEFEFCLRSCEIESGNTDTVENGDPLQPRLDPCMWGSHDAILDEEIGFKCRNCSIIIQEIRDVVAPFRKDPVERYVKRDFRSLDDDFFRMLPTESITNDLNSSFPSALDGTVWDLIPGTKYTLYPHQREGFEFIWKNIAGTIDLSKARSLKESNDGSGCIISHAPGTGKSRLTIVFLQAYLRFFPDCRPVIIAPKSMLLTWEDEFKKWNVDFPFHNVNNNELSGKEDSDALAILARLQCWSPYKDILRMVKLYSWKCQSSVLGISYTLFEKLTFGRTTGEDDWSEGNVLLKLPGVLVLDEGHTPRNNDTLIWQALSSVRTQKRICLSGTPFQNNFNELFNTFCMARPGFASTMANVNKGNSLKRRGRKPSAVKSNWANLTNSICENNVNELENLKAIISPFVHVYTGNVLRDTLPGLSHKIIYLRPGPLQKSLLQSTDGIANIMERRHITSLISVHPSLLLQHSSAVIGQSFPMVAELRGMQLTLQDGVKTKFLIEFLRLTEALKEKVLVFSDYIDPLVFLKDQLKSCFCWTEGVEVLYMDGKLDVKQRQASISVFNEEGGNAKVLLASKKACCEGISLVGASRVVFLDAAWNPSVQRQAISRAYRLGQKKFVYVYHLITFATIEEDVYRLQMRKDRISNMVFPSAKGNDIDCPQSSTDGPEDKILLEMLEHSTITNFIEKVV